MGGKEGREREIITLSKDKFKILEQSYFNVQPGPEIHLEIHP